MGNETIQQASVTRLANPRRKGILGLIFSRFFIIVLLILVELAVMILPVILLRDYLHHFFLGLAIFTLIMMIYLFNSKMDSTAKLTWMLLISVLQVAGALMLLFTQTNFGHRMIRKRAAFTIEETKDAIQQDPQVVTRLRQEDSYTDDLLTYLNRSGCFPAFANTETTYFSSGEEKFRAMLEELAKAEEYIFMEYFIIEEGYMWGKILEILMAKAKAGVDVRVMYDGMCEISTLPSNYCKLLEAEGIKAKSFAPIRPFISSHYNYRDHRKICVIDGKVAFNGGVNLADEYINEIERFGHWKDTAVMLKGEAVWSMTVMFLHMWKVIAAHDTPINYEDYLPEKSYPANSYKHGFIQPFCDSPLDKEIVGENVYLNIINRAKKYVYICTPYLIIDNEMMTALCLAAKSGVDVRIMTPSIPDKKLVFLLTQSYYEQLLDAGVKIYEYIPGFLHAKSFVCDDELSVVGTINLDYRSLYLHFEDGVWIYKNPVVQDIKDDFINTLKYCDPVPEEVLKKRGIFIRGMQSILRLVAPML